MNKMNIKAKIFLDVDDVVLDFQGSFSKRFNTPKLKKWTTSEKMKNRLNTLKKERDFWTNMPKKHTPDFMPSGFVSARNLPVSWTKEALGKNSINGRSRVLHVKWNQSKIETLKSLGCEIFIDDCWKTVKECNKAGIFCLMMDASHNQRVKTDLRIFNLSHEEILNRYVEHLTRTSTLTL